MKDVVGLLGEIVAALHTSGFRYVTLEFRYVTLDLEGFRSGSQNLVLTFKRPTSR
jgi:hypothetical protein